MGGGHGKHDKSEAGAIQLMKDCYGEIEELLRRKKDLTDYRAMMVRFDNLFMGTKTFRAKGETIPEEMEKELKEMRERFPDLTEDDVAKEISRSPRVRVRAAHRVLLLLGVCVHRNRLLLCVFRRYHGVFALLIVQKCICNESCDSIACNVHGCVVAGKYFRRRSGDFYGFRQAVTDGHWNLVQLGCGNYSCVHTTSTSTCSSAIYRHMIILPLPEHHRRTSGRIEP